MIEREEGLRRRTDLGLIAVNQVGDDDEMQFFAGQSLLETEDFALAIRYLSRCIEIGESSGDLYYAD